MSPHHRQRRARLVEIVIIAGLMLLPLLFWWQLWALDPANRAVIPEGDFASQYYPLQLFAAREVAAGRLPAWDPYINAGQPGLADIQTGTFYPPNLLPNLAIALLGGSFPLGMLVAQVIFHFSLASLFTYLFVRHLAMRAGARLRAARFAGAVAALSFTYAGYLTSFPVQQLTILETAIWLPLVLLFLDRAFHHKRPGLQVLLAGLALACAMLAGHPQTAMYVVYAVLAYGAFLTWFTKSADPESRFARRGFRLASHVLSVLGLGAALAAVQLVPTLEFMARSTRAGLDYQTAARGFPLDELTHLLYPGFFGGSPQYVGVVPLVLAVAALFAGRARREAVFWSVFGLVALILAFGGNTFLYDLAYLLAPGFGAVRNQERIVCLFSFAVSVLAGYGAIALAQPLPRAARRGYRGFVRSLGWVGVAFLALTALWYLGYQQGLQQGVEINLFYGVLRHHMLLVLCLGGALVLLVLRLTGKARRAWLMVLALGLIWLNLFTVNWRYNQAEPDATGEAFPESGLVAFLKGQPGTFRISSAGVLPGGSSSGIVYELEDITGNTPLQLEAFREFEERVGSWRRWQLLNVEYVLSRRDLDGPGLERLYEEGEAKVYRVGDPLPRSWVVHQTVVAGDDQVFDLLNGADFDPRTVAVLPPEEAMAMVSGVGEPGSPAQLIEASPGRLVLNVSSSSDGLLVISQPFYPGWRAEVDGERAPIHRVNHLLQGVTVRGGKHQVRLTYHLSPLPGAISLVTLAGCIVGLMLFGRRREASEGHA